MNRLVEHGSTLLVIEHNLEVIAQADWVIEMGPGAGRNGGKIVFQGTVERLVADDESLTGVHLQRHLQDRLDSPVPRAIYGLPESQLARRDAASLIKRSSGARPASSSTSE